MSDFERDSDNTSGNSENGSHSEENHRDSVYSYSYRDRNSTAHQGDYDARRDSRTDRYEGQNRDGSYGNDYGDRRYDGDSGRYSYQSDPENDRRPRRTYRRPRKKRVSFDGVKHFFTQKNNFGANLIKVAALAVVFGLIAGGIIRGMNPDRQAQVASTDTSESDSSADSSSSGDISGMVSRVMPSIVSITTVSQTEYYDLFGQSGSQEQQGSGSGIIVADDDKYLYIATNNHVVEDARSLTVAFSDDTTGKGTIKGTQESSDLAVVTVKKSELKDSTLKTVKVASLGDSSKLKVGEQAVAIGNALGYGQSVTTGVISALDRQVTTQDESSGKSTTSTLIQTDAAINPGNSGGALLNVEGKVIGINSVKYSDTSVEGMGYAIPISKAEPIINNLIKRKAVSKNNQAYLGISGVDVTSTAADTYNLPEGVYVAKVENGGAAEAAGLKEGDVITRFAGHAITSMDELKDELSYYAAGSRVKMEYKRASNGSYKTHTVTVRLGKKK